MSVFIEWKKGALADINEFKITDNPRQPLKYSHSVLCMYRLCLLPCICAPCYCSKRIAVDSKTIKNYRQRGNTLTELCINGIQEPLKMRMVSLHERLRIRKAQLLKEAKVFDMYEVFTAFFQVMNVVPWKYKMIDWLEDQLQLFEFVYHVTGMTPYQAPGVVLVLLEKMFCISLPSFPNLNIIVPDVSITEKTVQN